MSSANPAITAAPSFPKADFARARVLLATGRRGPEECAIAFDLLRRCLEYAEQLQQQRTALRSAIRSIVVEREGRLCYLLGDEQAMPMPLDVERAVRGAIAAARPSAG